MAISIKYRFTISFTANLIRSGITIGTAVLLARWLGPTDYGRMSFLFATFTAVRGLLDLGASSAFFTLISRRHRTRRFFMIFWGYIAIQLTLALLLLLILLPDSIVSALWVGESREMLVLAFFAAFMQGTVWTLAAQMAEASRQTIRVHKINLIVVSSHLTAVVALALMGELAIPLIFFMIIVEWSVAAWLLFKSYVFLETRDSINYFEIDTPKSVFMVFFAYCAPLMPALLLGFLLEFADRWMLQSWGGANEQAYFSIGQQFSAIALLATASVMNILWKEVAEAHHQQDANRVKMLYQRASRMLFFVGAVLAGGLQPLASDILRLSVGQAYLNASLTMSVLFLYPVHQSIGQINGMLMLATGKTKEYSIISIFTMIFSLLVLYVMLAPASMPVPGLGLGSLGLALKQVGVQFLAVNVFGLIIARIFGWKFDWLYQLLLISGCLLMGWISYYISFGIWGESGFLMVKVAFMVTLYLLFVGFSVYLFPFILTITRNELISAFRNFFKGIYSIAKNHKLKSSFKK